MMKRRMRSAATLCAVSLLLFAGDGCKRFRKTRSAPKSEAYADKIRPIVESHVLKVMHWPNFADYETLVQTFYDDRNYEVAWVDSKKPSAQAVAFIQAFRDAAKKGLAPADYDAGLWQGRLDKLAGGSDDDIAQFDAAMTVSVMRYISDLRLGRVNPTHFNFDIHTDDKRYNLPEFVSDNAVDASDVPGLIRSVEPDNEQYRKTEEALGHYLDLARQQAADPGLQQQLPTVAKPVALNGSYEALVPLFTRLALEGDLANATAPATAYTQEVSDGVKHYQARHGITPDGKLTAATVASLNVPMEARVRQIDDSLERWRWLPNDYINAPLMVNLPEFVLRGYTNAPDQTGSADHKLDFTMKVVVGKVVGEHQTPVFTHKMKFLIFRPYWNVPISIIKKELAAHIEKSGVGYLASKNFETVDAKGQPIEATASQVVNGRVVVREKPGPKNSLGLVKFMFPNEYDIYLHSTPAPELFNRTRRDFSHGCVRVQKPADLAVWVLRNTPGNWDLDKVNEAFANEQENNKTVVLKQPIPIVIFYVTAHVGDAGEMDFFDDIYGYDRQLEGVVAKGMPYPGTQQKVNPQTVFGDTT